MDPVQSSGITILGLGPGNASLLTRQAWEWINQIPEIMVRTCQHPAVGDFPKKIHIQSFDTLYENSNDFQAVYDEIVKRIIELGQRPEGVTYAVPGHPFVAEVTCPEIIRRAREMGIPVRIIEGLSFIEPVFTALGIDPFSQLLMMDALELGQKHYPPFPPSIPVLVAQIYSRLVASEVKLTLNAVYPDEHRVKLVHGAGTAQQCVEELALYEIDRSNQIGLMTALFLPPLEPGTAFEEFQEIVAQLRAPNGCPWDREQTHLTLRTHLLEETYEALSALDAENPEGMKEEFGDLLLQIVLHAQIACEVGEFTMADILKGIFEKIVRRHPHVFGNVQVEGVKGVLSNWEKLKAEERITNGQNESKGLLDGVPKVYPALAQAQEIQERAARVGFDWPEIKPVIEKILEELDEVKQSKSDLERQKELGDLLFAVVNLVRWFHVDAESTLRQTNQKFRKRFSYIEKQAHQLGKNLSEMKLAEMDVLWEEAKQYDD